MRRILRLDDLAGRAAFAELALAYDWHPVEDEVILLVGLRQASHGYEPAGPARASVPPAKQLCHRPELIGLLQTLDIDFASARGDAICVGARL